MKRASGGSWNYKDSIASFTRLNGEVHRGLKGQGLNT